MSQVALLGIMVLALVADRGGVTDELRRYMCCGWPVRLTATAQIVAIFATRRYEPRSAMPTDAVLR